MEIVYKWKFSKVPKYKINMQNSICIYPHSQVFQTASPKRFNN